MCLPLSQSAILNETSILPLSLKGASARFRGKVLVGPVDLTIGENGLSILMGPNGSGKTTLLRLMHGMQRSVGGKITWNVPTDQAMGRQAFVFQTPTMMRRNVMDSIAFPLLLRGMGRMRAHARAIEWAQKIGLGDALSRPAPFLSGGEKQKLSLARALITRPDILFLDEPCANLDGKATREIETILLEAKTAGTRMVMATHDMGQARRLASDVLFMYDGKLHEAATAKTFFAGPKTREARMFIKGDIVE